MLGANHPETLIACSEIANLTGSAGDYSSARDQLVELLPTLRKVLGASHPETLIAESNFAHWVRRSSDGSPQ
ncbi:tetratricopeptide repeat protein [Micromonospora sp. LOL_014]|uniref:tetratricopeptide repeat protein n=1 Tax=Micromonospora sp. LOL_014 TaxID=3345415 RepID=UPI003A883FC5